MYKVNQKITPNVFLLRFQKTSHFYPTKFSELNYVQTIYNIITSKYSISIREPYMRNSYLNPEKKQVTTMHKSKAIIKLRLLFLENELILF